MDTFWHSNSNKMQLQLLVKDWIVTNASKYCPGIKLVCSGLGTDIPTPAVSMENNLVIELSNLTSNIEEADLRYRVHNGWFYYPQIQIFF